MTDDGDPTTESIGDSDSSSRGSSAKNTTPAITPIPPSPTSTSPMSTSPTSTSAYDLDNSSLVPFASESLHDNSNEIRTFIAYVLFIFRHVMGSHCWLSWRPSCYPRSGVGLNL